MKQTEIVGVEDTLIPEDWEVKRLGEIGEPCMCKRILKEQTSPTGDIPFYKIGTFGGIPDAYISRELFEQYKEQYNYPKKGTLLLSAAGTIGRVVVFDGKDSYFQDSNIVWIDNDETKVTNDFLFYCYSRMQWKTEEGGIVSRLYNANLKSTSFIAPKSLAEQQRIAKAFSDVDALISTTEKLIKKKKNIKQGAMQNLLTGKKRLPGFGSQTKPPTYKQTELGPIPEDWEVKTLGELGSFKNGISKPSEDFGFGSPFVNLMDIFGITKISETNHLGLINSNIIEQNTYSLKEGDVLFVRSSVKPEGVGLTTVIKKDLDKTVYSGFILRFREIGNELTTDFKEYVFYNKGFRDSLISSSTVSANTNINQPALKNLIIVYPSSKEEQTAIANVLSSMDKEIETLNTKLEKYRNLKTAMMQQLLTGKIRLV